MAEASQEINLTCRKCPEIEGSSWCKCKQKTIWREDKMCEDGYLLRIKRGIDMIARTEDEDKCEAIYKKVLELEEIWRKDFYKEENNGTEQQPIEPVSKPDIPF